MNVSAATANPHPEVIPDPEGIADPVAVVLVDTGLPHLDRPFEYAVPPELAATAHPGVRVKVRFAGQDLGGFIIERRARAEHEGPLASLRKVVSDEPALTPAVLALAREVARHYGGTVGDVLRLAVPPRHARAETNLPRAIPNVPPPPPGATVPDPPALPDAAAAAVIAPGDGSPAQTAAQGDASAPLADSPWDGYAAGSAFLRRLTAGDTVGASWLALPHAPDADLDWPPALADAAAAALRGGRGSILLLPDARDVDRVDRALTRRLGPGRHVLLTAEQGPQARYTAWLKVLRGHVQVVVGNRSAAYAPVRDLGLVAVWDDGDDLHEEPRAPYPHSREVALLRSRLEGAAILIGGFTRTVAAAALVEQGMLRTVAGAPAQARRCVPGIVVAGEGLEPERDPGARAARIPTLAWRTAHEALARGPVLVQVPRAGYVPTLACASCRTLARCTECHGPVGVGGSAAPPSCRWCGHVHQRFVCPVCAGSVLRSRVVGARRTAEELGRAFPGTMVLTSAADSVLTTVPERPVLVVATPGAEPPVAAGYAAALLLDAWALLGRSSLDVGIEALRRWAGAAALVAPRSAGGTVVLCGVPDHETFPAVEALVRWAPQWLASRELAERTELQLPPAVTFAQVTGSRKAVAEVAAATSLPASVARFGPRNVGEGESRLLLRASLSEGSLLAEALAKIRATRSGRKDPDPLHIHVGLSDPG